MTLHISYFPLLQAVLSRHWENLFPKLWHTYGERAIPRRLWYGVERKLNGCWIFFISKNVPMVRNGCWRERKTRKIWGSCLRFNPMNGPESWFGDNSDAPKEIPRAIVLQIWRVLNSLRCLWVLCFFFFYKRHKPPTFEQVCSESFLKESFTLLKNPQVWRSAQKVKGWGLGAVHWKWHHQK